jgi:7,8-dihydropterin-6-yl-methyl-4-(beta-D-ribofuranosyl)aminobenzene 5'-phosphate synthase
MRIKITTLSENTAGRPDVLAEWGLCMLVEEDGQSILLDAGETHSAIHNAENLDIDLRCVTKIVLSHGHFDHTGGLRPLLQKMKQPVDIFAHPDIWALKYNRREGKPDRFIGIPFAPEELTSLGAKFTLSRSPVQLTENIWTTGEIPLVTDFESVEPSLFVKTENGWKPDPVLDDRGLIIKTPMGLVVVLGCAHRGMINTLYHAREITGLQKIHMVLGGCHLISATDEQIWQTISFLNEMGVKKVALSHCTGMHATMILSQTYGDDFIFNHTGNIIELI